MPALKIPFYRKSQKGLTLIELLVVIAMIVLLIIVLLLLLMRQLGRGRDAQRKADLEEIKISFEDYYNDNGCYPPAEVLEDCDGSSFSPYLKAIPCDPVNGDPYYYVPWDEDACGGYRIYASLEDIDDPVISALDCDGPNGCGFGAEYNYGVSVGIPVAVENETHTIYQYACDSAGTCNRYESGHPFLKSCPKTWETPGCEGQCGNSSYWCD
jgi:type II secretory pathway pseudopilin PulG